LIRINKILEILGYKIQMLVHKVLAPLSTDSCSGIQSYFHVPSQRFGRFLGSLHSGNFNQIGNL
jgi:hypothetical protein